MEIDLGNFGAFITSHRLTGGIALGIPIVFIGSLFLYRIVRRVPFLKQMMQTFFLSIGLSLLLLIPFVFVTAFAEVEMAKLVVIFFVIVIHSFLFFIFNTKASVKFLLAWSNRQKNGS